MAYRILTPDGFILSRKKGNTLAGHPEKFLGYLVVSLA